MYGFGKSVIGNIMSNRVDTIRFVVEANMSLLAIAPVAKPAVTKLRKVWHGTSLSALNHSIGVTIAITTLITSALLREIAWAPNPRSTDNTAEVSVKKVLYHCVGV